MKVRKGVHAMKPMPSTAVRKAYITGAIRDGVQHAYKEGQVQGYILAMESVQKAVYAACVLSLRKQLGFGKQRIERFMRAVDEVVWGCINSEELTDEVFEKTGIKIDLSEIYSEDRIKAAYEEAAHNA